MLAGIRGRDDGLAARAVHVEYFTRQGGRRREGVSSWSSRARAANTPFRRARPYSTCCSMPASTSIIPASSASAAPARSASSPETPAPRLIISEEEQAENRRVMICGGAESTFGWCWICEWDVSSFRDEGGAATAADSPRLRCAGEKGRGEGESPRSRSLYRPPSPGAQARADLSPQAGRGSGVYGARLAQKTKRPGVEPGRLR